MRLSIPMPNRPRSVGAPGAASHGPGERARSMAEFSVPAFRPPWRERGWAWLLDQQVAASLPALLRMRVAEDAQRLALQAMTESEERFRQLALSVSDVLWIYEPQGKRFLYVSPAYERGWKRSAKALYADPQEWLNPVHRDDRQCLQEAFDHLAGGDSYALEYRVTLSSGEQRWIAERAFPVATQSGQMSRIAGVSQDITARKKAELELLRSDRHKDEFLAMLGHELRNPLEPIRSAAALLARQHVDGPAIEQKAVAVIERQVNHLTRLVDDLLDVARLNHGKIRLRSEVVRLEEVIGAAVDANRTFAQMNRLRLQVELPPSDVWVVGDAVRLTQVFSNLLHNATKFSVPDGVIEISVRPSESDMQVAVSVRDEGSGISADLIDSVFDLFTQEAQSAARDRGGLGIGLSVARSLIELHGGNVSVHSDGIGKGSEFVVTLPVTDARPAVASAPIRAHNRTSRRILLVDNNRDAAETLQALLEIEGHSVALAFGGQSALEQVAHLKPEIVILDIRLPDISGYDVARRLRADTSLSPPLLVALTGYGREQDRQVALEAGFDHHLVKPADHARLMQILSG